MFEVDGTPRGIKTFNISSYERHDWWRDAPGNPTAVSCDGVRRS
jgi:hypothetical protein